MSPLRAGLLISITVMLVPLAACSLVKPRWTMDAQEKPALLEKARMARDSVVLEVMFIHVAPHHNQAVSHLWENLDETHLPIELRRHLDANGIRCGLIGGSFPESLVVLMEADRNTTDLEQRSGNVLLQSANRIQRMQFRSGQPGRIVVSPSIHEQLSVFLVDGNYMQGKTYKQAQCLLGLRTYPLGDGRIRLEVVPEIHHGQARSQFVGQNGAWLLKSDREVERFDQLEIIHVLSPGQSLLLSSSSTSHGMGGSFFRDTAALTETSIIVLIRLAQTQRDDLFDIE
jgi:hypothetical protein